MISLRSVFAYVLLLSVVSCQTKKPATAVPAEQTGAARYLLAETEELAPGPCSACGSIKLVRFGDRGPGPVDQPYVEDLARQLRTTYGLDVRIAEPLALPANAYNPRRQQWDGEQLVDVLGQKFPAPPNDGSTVIGLMNEDIYLGFKPEWSWAFGARTTFAAGGGWAVISAHRMAGMPAARRMMVLLGKYVGGIACGFNESPDRSSIMFNNVLSANDLDGMDTIACSVE